METYNNVDVAWNGQRIGSADVAVGMDWGRGEDETVVAAVEREPAGQYEVKWSMAMSKRDARRLMGRREHLCWKCRDGRTRAHHRLCWRRGGSIGLLRAAQTEALAAYNGEPSPGRLPGRLGIQVAAIGRRVAACSQRARQIYHGLSPLTESPARLKELAALLGVERGELAESVREVA